MRWEYTDKALWRIQSSAEYIMRLSTITRCSVLLLLTPALASAETRATKIGDTVVGPKALTTKDAHRQGINGLSFQQEAVVAHRGYQYVGYYDGKRRVCIARRALPDGTWYIVRFSDYHFASNDSHNVICIGICQRDATLHMAFDHHVHPSRCSRRSAAVASASPTNSSAIGSYSSSRSNCVATLPR